jgi:hypothetical protein
MVSNAPLKTGWTGKLLMAENLVDWADTFFPTHERTSSIDNQLRL